MSRDSDNDRLRTLAIQAIGLMDLTSLNDSDSEQSIRALCERALTPAGPVAAVCVYPRFVTVARKSLDDLELKGRVRLATVANFPGGDQPLDQVIGDIELALADGADEIDVVFPWQALVDGDTHTGEILLAACRKACGDHRLKVILESGELGESALIRQAARLATEGGADFIKTSTGKVEVNATLSAATIMLETIRENGGEHGGENGRDVGFKASGGIRKATEAAAYLALAEQMMGLDWVTPDHFRFGASGLLDDLLGVVNGKPSGSMTDPAY